MTFWEIPDLLLDEDAVLRGQGANPAAIRLRSPKLVEYARNALQDGLQYLEPQVLYKKLEMKSVSHEKIILENGKKLSGPLIVKHLCKADYIVLFLCTIGVRLEEYTSSVIKEKVAYGFALDGVGSAAVEAIANAACKFFEDRAEQNGLQASITLNPGMIGWEVKDGQPEIFDILDASQLNVRLLPSGLMTPRKSLTMVMGFGPDMEQGGKTCDYCAMSATCKYKDHYESTN
jgi:hypothetical protein